MFNRSVLIVTALIVAAFLGIFLLYALSNFSAKGTQSRIDPKEISNVVISKDGQHYLLNFTQQEAFLDILNQAQPFNQQVQQPMNVDIEKIEVIFFEKPSLFFKPLYLINQEYVFSIPEWNKKGLIKENSQGQLNQLLKNSYD